MSRPVRKVIRRDDTNALRNMLMLANIDSECIEVVYTDQMLVIKSKHLECVTCGCNDETKLIRQNGIILCTKCIEKYAGFSKRTEDL